MILVVYLTTTYFLFIYIISSICHLRLDIKARACGAAHGVANPPDATAALA